MNAPNPTEWIIVPEGVKKVTVERDTKIPNAATFIVQREDHTLGNIVRYQLLRDRNVLFAGYKIPHPLEPCCIIKVQTNHEATPVKALSQALSDLISEFDSLATQFKEEVEKRRGSYHGAYL